jgi:putative tryptophan/tyrosine transport system substrate-binding protein
VRRRDFITLLGSAAAAWPLAARAQQAMPVVGFLTALSEAETAYQIIPFRRGLSEGGFVEGRNVAIEYRFADGQYERLTTLAAEFVRRPVSLIVGAAPPAALAAKVATTTIPIVFIVGLDPVAAGLVASFNRPGGNATGISLVTGPLGQKRVEFLQEFMPKAAAIAMLVNPVSPDAVPEIRDVQAVAHASNVAIRIINASTAAEIESAFVALANSKPERLLVGSDPFFVLSRPQITALAAKLGVPTIYPFREFAAAGGLMSYGTSLAGAYREAGVYVSRILNGANPSDLPVLQPTKFELVVNLKTAKALGLEIPPTLLARADEVIE